MDRNLVFSFELFGKTLSVYWYGVMIAIGILCCFSLFLIYAKCTKFEEKFTDFCFYTIIASIACGFGSAALFQAFYNFLDNPSAGFRFSGGLTFIGGLIGGVGFYLIIYAIFRTKFNDRLPKLLPILGPCVTIAHGFGRIGCFIAGCCYGKPTNCDYGCYFDTSVKVHPTQLYEAIFLLILCGVLTFIAFKYTENPKGIAFNEYNVAIYLIAYGTFRFINEFFRGDSRGKLFGAIPPSQFWAIVMVLLGVGYIFAIKYRLFDKFGRFLDIRKNNKNIKK
ncbi:MAG: prolipoprotein diacylglyceryl transferase [Clostridia bacterium]|nr:prolipoprotein diacylglyceryl transferase [Clostridia bacterium]